MQSRDEILQPELICALKMMIGGLILGIVSFSA
jgi:hypothetical protein